MKFIDMTMADVIKESSDAWGKVCCDLLLLAFMNDEMFGERVERYHDIFDGVYARFKEGVGDENARVILLEHMEAHLARSEDAVANENRSMHEWVDGFLKGSQFDV